MMVFCLYAWLDWRHRRTFFSLHIAGEKHNMALNKKLMKRNPLQCMQALVVFTLQHKKTRKWNSLTVYWILCRHFLDLWSLWQDSPLDFTAVLILWVGQRRKLRRRSSAIADLRYLHGQLQQLWCVPAGAADAAVQFQVAAATVPSPLIPLTGCLDVFVWGKTSAQCPFTCVWQHDYKIIETTIETGKQHSCAVICKQRQKK